MDGPPPPRDVSLRNIIDKLAEFVARNGPEFEMITKQKQQNNPKFEFLYGGEHAAYYQYRVAGEQAYLKQQSSGVSTTQTPHFTQGPPPNMMHHTSGQMPPISQNDANNSFTLSQPPPNLQLWNTNASSLSTTTNNTLTSQSSSNGNSQSVANNYTAQIEALNMQQNTLREQIRQSESNLTAQHTALMAQQKTQIEEAIEAAQNSQLETKAEELNISLSEFDSILQPIIDACTKDSISQGKNWILQHSTDSAKNNVVLQYLLKKALVDGTTFQQKLHLIYLINDILHHCVRKNANDLKNSLENVVIPMFCSADLIASTEQRTKLTKLLSLWESKAKFFDACVISKLQSPDSSMHEYKTNLQNLHHEVTAKFTQAVKAQLDNYQKQHKIFIQHATQQITQLEQQKQQLEQQMLAAVLPNTSIMPPTTVGQQQHQQQSQQQQQVPQQLIKNIPSLMAQKVAMPVMDDNDHHYGNQQGQQQNNKNFFIPDLSKPPPGFMSGGNANIAPVTQISALMQQPSFAQMNSNIPVNQNLNNPPPNLIASGDLLNNVNNLNVDLLNVSAALQLVHQQQQQQLLAYDQQSKLSSAGIMDNEEECIPPPPSLLMEPEPEQIPSAAYYDLPAGLMVPLIRLEDYRYKSLDPVDIRLPPPAPQNERLTNALAAFYALPTHDRPRDNEGWEKLGLYEYYKVKNAARKQKEEEIKDGVRERSRSPSPIIMAKPVPKKVNKRCYRSKSRSRSRSPYKSKSRSRSQSPLPQRSQTNRGGGGGGVGNDRGRNNRYNRQRSRSPRRSPARDRERERDRDRERDNNDNNRSNERITRRERERSVTPPSFFGNSFAKPNEFIEESNKGHQMLMKMGWAGTGTGLGTKNQGIDQPISAGDVRDRKDMYKGVGVNMNDPFENFRKNKGAAFVHRMRARDEKS
ncbi:calcium homeostasis endoplasmic reticulum protein [Calliphora vicina]|uniref:calcium homeostasis endoplasmic reticulum protein n=1 Tax=Calliphora vicina TaxID=7373 RepID=UPI00325AF7C3